MLEGLQPHQNLPSLEIDKFQGEVLPNCTFVENLVWISLSNRSRCELLPILGKLSKLKILKIYKMNNVRSIGNEFYGIESNNHRNSFAFPKLEILDITWMEKVQQWDEATVNASNLFGSLKELSISVCHQLKNCQVG